MGDMQTEVQAVLDRLVGSGAERGLQVAVYRHGEQVVDAVAGVSQVLRDDVAGPLGVAGELFFGVPAEWGRRPVGDDHTAGGHGGRAVEHADPLQHGTVHRSDVPRPML
jgi:hypothetical protein